MKKSVPTSPEGGILHPLTSYRLAETEQEPIRAGALETWRGVNRSRANCSLSENVLVENLD